MEGFLLVDKPEGYVSFKLVSGLRQLTGIKKIGFAGTLDPFATGLMVMAIGRRYTRQLDCFHSLPKTYHVGMQLGVGTNTLDKDGQELYRQPYVLDVAHAQQTLLSFMGTYLQIPPMFSAKKKEGKKLYELARKGIDIKLEPSEVTIFDLKWRSWEEGDFPFVSFDVTCSKGTYVRSLVRDIAIQLGTQATTVGLRRTSIGSYTDADALTWPISCVDRIHAALIQQDML